MLPRELLLFQVEQEALANLAKGEAYSYGECRVERFRTPGCHTYQLTVQGQVVRRSPNPRAVVSSLLLHIQLGDVSHV